MLQRSEVYYNQYKNIELVLNAEMVKFLALYQQQTFLKVKEYIIHGIIYSTSLVKAKILVKVNKETLEAAFKSNNSSCFLNIGFLDQGSEKLTNMTIPSKVLSINEYNGAACFVNIEFISAPSSYFISKIGSVLDAESSIFNKAKRQVIFLDKDSMKKLGLAGKSAIFSLENEESKDNGCILNSISISTASLLIKNVNSVLVDKMITIKIKGLQDMAIKGKITDLKLSQVHAGIAEIDVELIEEHVPISYKHMLNLFLK